MTDPTSATVVQVRSGDVTARPWVLLHGSDGRESDLLPLAERVAPSASKIAPRGTAVTPEGFAHFHRRPDRTLDEDDIRLRVDPLAQLLRSTLTAHGLHEAPYILGYSNGAIMAAALLSFAPDLFGAAVLLRPLTPYTDSPMPALRELPVLVLDAAYDTRRSPGDGARQSRILARAGAHVTHMTLLAEHPLSDQDEHAIRVWLHGHRTE